MARYFQGKQYSILHVLGKLAEKNCIFYDILQNGGWVANMISFPNKIMTIGLVPESLDRKLKP